MIETSQPPQLDYEPLEYTLSDFDYELPPGRIAKYPLPNRDDSRMMVLDRAGQGIGHHFFKQLPDFLNAGDLMVINNARVLPARLLGRREGHTGQVEIFLMHPRNADKTEWDVLMKPARKLRPGTRICFERSGLVAEIIDRLEMGHGIVRLHWPQNMTFEAILEQTGTLPIPPYLERETEAIDTERYQTVFAKHAGAQAAPTAGLHFTPAVFEALKAKGIGIAEITLNVSAGTFRPVLDEAIDSHQMDAEFYTIPDEAAQQITETQARGGRIIAIGTTVAKTLETAYRLNGRQIKPGSAWSRLFIRPGFEFKTVDMLLTNFHLPKSTLMMLVSAFADRDLIMAAYDQAVAGEYRFYSYGDCMLIQ